MRIVALAGGVGGAKLAHGFSKILKTDEFSVIVNTGDDFSHFGLTICPDIDTVCYTIAEKSNPLTGWGREHEKFTVFETLKEFGAPDWFLLGDKDLALHLERTRLISEGKTLTDATVQICGFLGVSHSILPMTNDRVRTMVQTHEYGEIPFQEYFVKYKYQPKTSGFRFDGVDKAIPTLEILSTLNNADLIVICPSNPFVSINPILSLPGIRDIMKQKFVIGVSPIIGGSAIKGPLGLMLADQNQSIHPKSVAEMYKDFLNIFIIDHQDDWVGIALDPSSIIIKKEAILIPDIHTRINLANKIINLYEKNK
jgi:LPPG:FO 2-phospho-L-lactate transferase